jgi:hypothetical protein
VAETDDTVTLTAADGLRLTVPDFYREVPERESPEQPLVAVVKPEADPGEFTPTITVGVQASTPALASIGALGLATIERQHALGRHVVAVDVWPVPGQPDGRRIESLYVEGEATVLELQYLTLRAGRAITLSVLVLASAHGFGNEMFGYVAGTLALNGPGEPMSPDGAADPGATDGDALAGPGHAGLESLAGVRASQPFHGPGERLDLDDLKALRASRRRHRLGRPRLVAAGLLDPDGQLTGAGASARDLLVRAKAQLLAEVTVPGGDGPHKLEALLGGAEVGVLADVPAGGAGTGKTLEVIPALALGVTLVRWLGLAPAWSFDPAAPPERETTIARAIWEARLTDPGTSPPRGATSEFIALWEQPWELATVRTTKRWRNGPGSVQYLSTPDAGYVLVIPDAHGRFVRLESRPSAQLLHALLVVAGIVDRREPQ